VEKEAVIRRSGEKSILPDNDLTDFPHFYRLINKRIDSEI